MKGRSPRTRARSWVLQLLYAWEISGEPSLIEFAEREMLRRRVGRRYRPHIDRLLRSVEGRVGGIDSLLEECMENWRIERLSAIDRNILRLAVAELTSCPDVPVPVVIHEAIRLAEKYGSIDSPRFVNGVLDAVSRKIPVTR
ncbi:MAG: transcription antitermination factor NusB [Gemmatimonadota bacterium]